MAFGRVLAPALLLLFLCAPLSASASIAGCWLGDCSVDPDTYNPACTMSLSQSIISATGSSTLSWDSNLLSPYISPGIGVVAKMGSVVVSPGATTNYTLYDNASAYGWFRASLYALYGIPSPVAECGVVLSTSPEAAAPPVCTLSAFPATITQGNSVTLTYTITGSSTSAYLQDVGPVPLDPQQYVVTPSASKTYQLSVYGESALAQCSASVQVNPPPGTPSLSLETSHSKIASGKKLMLAWSGKNVTSCTVTDSYGSTLATSTQNSLPAPTFTVLRPTIYTLRCGTSAGATLSRSVLVQMIPGVAEQ